VEAPPQINLVLEDLDYYSILVVPLDSMQLAVAPEQIDLVDLRWAAAG
jgi:hypothetical protein